MEQDAADHGGGQGQVHRLVFLQSHVHISQPAADEGAVLGHADAQGPGILFPGEPDFGESVSPPSQALLLPDRKSVCPRPQLAK